MNYLFRVDAGGKTGLGHFFRSVNLAKKLTSRGHKVIFVHEPSLFWTEQKKTNFQFEVFKKYDSYTELKLIKEHNVDKFFVDGIIEFDSNYISEIKTRVEVIFYQNLSDSKSLADTFILPSIHQGPSFFEGFKNPTKIYRGLQYFTFSERIERLPIKKPAAIVKSVGIIAGGSDPNNTLEKLLSMLKNFDLNSITFTFYYGIDSAFKEVFLLSKLKNSNINCLPYDHLKILSNDLLISAFGVSTYEFMALGMPIIAYGHQTSNSIAADYLASNTKGLVSLGLIDELEQKELFQELMKLIYDKEKRDLLIKNAKSSLDLSGIERVIKILENE